MVAAALPETLHAYRSLLRAAKLAFRDDLPTLSAALSSSRAAFDQNRNLPKNILDPQTNAQIQHANEVAVFLRKNLVQAERVDKDGNKVEGAQGDGLYRLRLHEDTERGDNEDIKKGKGKGVSGGGCCGGSGKN